MTVKEVSKALGLRVRTIRAWIDEGKLPARKVGRCLIIPAEAVYSKEVQERADKGRKHPRRTYQG